MVAKCGASGKSVVVATSSANVLRSVYLRMRQILTNLKLESASASASAFQYVDQLVTDLLDPTFAGAGVIADAANLSWKVLFSNFMLISHLYSHDSRSDALTNQIWWVTSLDCSFDLREDNVSTLFWTNCLYFPAQICLTELQCFPHLRCENRHNSSGWQHLCGIPDRQRSILG
jgi:hypothetical protein